MCGLAGMYGVPESIREDLIRALGEGIDARGGQGAGYVSIGGGKLRHNRKPGKWVTAKRKFIRNASGDLCMMHSRWPTHGEAALQNTHPFPVKRDNKVVLWGAHNGIIYDADDSAKRNQRPFSVDSLELFQLLADGMYKSIEALSGYGVITWIDAEASDWMSMVRLTSSGDIYVCKLTEGGIVWASTESICKAALEKCKLNIDTYYSVDPGVRYIIGSDAKNDPGFYSTDGRLSVSSGSRYRVGYTGWSYDKDDYADDKYEAQWKEYQARLRERFHNDDRPDPNEWKSNADAGHYKDQHWDPIEKKWSWERPLSLLERERLDTRTKCYCGHCTQCELEGV